ncbi:MAG: ABC transporter ATP-binding protein [Spirochaetota bacterium]
MREIIAFRRTTLRGIFSSVQNKVIEVEHLYKSYTNVQAVVDLSFEVEESTCFGFLGPNGAGKTTMMKTLYGRAVPDKREDTRIHVFDLDPRQHELQIKARSGVVPQEDSLDVELNVVQNLRIFSNLYGIPWPAARKRIDHLLDFMELGEKRKAKVKELSGGMKRRLIIARALLNSPSLLILDEPTTGLDPQVRHLIWDKIRDLKREGVTILLTTHYMDEAYQMSDRIIIMDRGKKVVEGAPQALLEEYMERHVLELLDPSHAAVAETAGGNGDIRKDGSESRILYYSNNLDILRKMTVHLQPGQYYLRQVNLEDLFLRTTGRSLNEKQ